MPPDPLLLLAALPAILFAGLAKGGFGGAASFAATPLLALAMPVEQAVGLLLPLLVVMDMGALHAFWGRWSVPDARALILSLAVGTALGWALWDALSPGAIQLAIGLIALAFVGFRAAQRLGWRPPGDPGFDPRRAGLWGGLAGLTSFVAHAGGPPVAMTLLPRTLDKTTYQATVVVAFAAVNLMKLGPYAALGLIRGDTLILAAILAPAALLGIRLGVRAHRRLSQEAFERVVVIGLVLAGLKLTRDGLLALS